MLQLNMIVTQMQWCGTAVMSSDRYFRLSLFSPAAIPIHTPDMGSDSINKISMSLAIWVEYQGPGGLYRNEAAKAKIVVKDQFIRI